MSTPDEIRAKRLARLGASSALAQTPPSASASPQPQTQPKPEATPTPKPQPVQQSQPPAQPAAQPAPEPVKKPTPKPEQSLSQWFVSVLPGLFGATLDPHDGKHMYLESVSADDHPESSLDEIFMEILGSIGVPTSSVVEYLHGVYRHAYSTSRRMPAATTSNYEAKTAVLKKVSKLACTYANSSFEEPDMFANSDPEVQVEWFVNHPQESGFLVDIVAQADEQGTVEELLNGIVPIATSKLLQLTVATPQYSNYISLFETLVSIKSVARVFSQIDTFEPQNPDDPLSFENTTILGALLRLSPLGTGVGQYYFSDIHDWKHPSQSALINDYSSINAENKVVTSRLFNIVNSLVRGGPDTRQAVVSWFARLINLSHLRTGSHADLTKLPGDGIMFNATLVLIRLSTPFLDYPVYSKLDKIAMNYVDTEGSVLNVDEESRVNASLDEVKEWRSQQMETEPNFISHCFYLTLTYLHYGMGGIFSHASRIKQQLKQLYQRLSMIEDESQSQSNAAMAAMIRGNFLPRLKQQAQQWESHRHTILALFGSQELELEIFDFVVGCCTYFMYVIDPNHAYPKQKLSIPYFEYSDVSQLDDADFLRSKAPVPWRFMPEYMIEGIINFCKFSTEFMACPLLRSDERKIMVFIELAIVLLRCPELLGNPHMKSNLVELLFIGSLPMQNGTPGFFVPIFQSNPMVKDNLLFCLLDFYVMVEKTGASSQFYDKFNSRYHVSVILEEIWKGGAHYKSQLSDYSKKHVSFFVRFVARMLNDTTYLLDESFNDLAKIHDYQTEIKHRAQGGPANEDLGTDEELAEKLESSERTARSCLGLANKTIELFKLFSKEVPKAFTLDEVVDRLAAMVDYNLGVLVGPKCSNLKVDQPEKYSFDPKRTLQDLCVIYVNLSSQDKFVKAVSRDGRSFNIAHFRKAQNILASKTFTDPKLLDKFIAFAEEAESKRQAEEDEDLALGDVPDEFLDPLMFTLMEDPVILPKSRISIDRSTIKAHLLSDPTDPFNRSPLKLEDVIPDEELKAKIEEFKQSKRNT
ncbi:E4 ubiquitin-protein ligase Ufd2p [Diutina rugosa]